MNYLIDFTQDATDDQISAYLLGFQCTVVKEYDHFEKVYLVTAPSAPEQTSIVASVVNDTATAIKLLADVVQSNPTYGRFDPTSPTVSFTTTDEKDWWKNYIQQHPDFDSPTFTMNRRGQSAHVYIMDSGIDATHPEFADANITNLFSFTGEFGDTNGHGTALASIVAGKTCGLTDANIVVAKVFDGVADTKQSDLLSALEAVLGHFKTAKSGLGILNCSWSIPHNVYIEQKIRTLIEEGIYVVVSAGNSGMPITDVTPASMRDALTIGSFNQDLKPSNFSNYTNPSVISLTQEPTNYGAIDGWAPGEQIWVAVPGGEYGFAAGTSLSAAVHTCALAYALSNEVIAGELVPFARQRELSWTANRCLRRDALLHIEDEKYATSARTITSIEKDLEYPQVDPTDLRNWVRVGDELVDRAFNPQTTHSVEILDPLPEGFSINEFGLLYGAPTSVDGDYQTHIYKVRVYGTDGSATDVTCTTTILSKTFDRDLYPANDPVVLVTRETCPSSCNSYCISAGYVDGGYCAGPGSKPANKCCACFNFATGNTSAPCGV